jgi:hypothetical protein
MERERERDRERERERVNEWFNKRKIGVHLKFAY